MADTALGALITSTSTVRILSMAGVLMYTPTVMPNSVIPPLVIPRQYGRITANSSTGNALVGTFDSGETDDGLDVPLSFLSVAPSETTASGLADLLRGLHDGNLTTKTGYSAVNVTSTLTHLGKQSAKLEITTRDNVGNARIWTATFCMKSLETADAGGKWVWNPVANIISSIVWS